MCNAMEYMALNKPVVAFKLKETRVTCGDVALYVSENRAGAFAEKIRELAESTD